MRISQHIGAALLLGSQVALAQASVVHKWIDADGVTHYSDEPPAASVTDLEQIELPTPPARAPGEPEDAYYSIANQWQRMHRERIELEKARAERDRDAGNTPRRGDTIVIKLPESRPAVAILPRRRPVFVAPKPADLAARRHPFAIPGRDWPVGLHPGRANLRGSFPTR